MTEESKSTTTEQEKLYGIWGLSKLAVRNIVVFFILSLMSSLVYSASVVARKDKDLEKCNEQHVTLLNQHAAKIEELMLRQVKLAQEQAEIQQAQQVLSKAIRKKSGR